jgi:peroxiredoxin
MPEGAQVVAISIDPPAESVRLKRALDLPFPLLSDEDRVVARRYHLVHAGGGRDGEDLYRPAELLLDGNGVIRWASFTENWRVRARPQAIAAALRSHLMGTAPAPAAPPR